MIEATHKQMVRDLIKSPEVILQQTTPDKCALIHDALGIGGEAAELIDAVKKHTMYDKPLDSENVIEELGDLEFFMEDLRTRIGVTRDEVLQANIDKLAKRYQNFQYSDAAAQARADKT